MVISGYPGGWDTPRFQAADMRSPLSPVAKVREVVAKYNQKASSVISTKRPSCQAEMPRTGALNSLEIRPELSLVTGGLNLPVVGPSRIFLSEAVLSGLCLNWLLFCGRGLIEILPRKDFACRLRLENLIPGDGLSGEVGLTRLAAFSFTFKMQLLAGRILAAVT